MIEGKHILVLEDEPLVAMLLEEMLLEAGCVVIGPASTIAEGARLAQSEPLDAAVLDVNVNGEMSGPVAAILRSRDIPYAYATGYGTSPEGATGEVSAPVLEKPFLASRLESLLQELLVR